MTLGIVAVTALPALAVEMEAASLEDAVKNTLETNPGLQVLKDSRDASHYDVRDAWGGYLPRITATARYGAENHSDVTTRAQDRDVEFYERHEASLTLTQNIWDGGITGALVDRNKALVESNDHRVFDNAEKLGLDAVVAYYTVYRERMLVELARRNLEMHETILESLKEREEMGATSAADVTQTQTRLARALSTLEENETNLFVALKNFERVVGASPAADLSYGGMPGNLPSTVEEAVARSLDSNPKLLAAKSDISAADSAEDLAWAQMFPRFSLEAQTSYDYGVEAAQDYSNTNYAMARVDWDIFTGGSNIAAGRAAAARLRQAQSESDDLYREITESTQATWRQHLSAVKLVDYYTQATDYSMQTRDMYQEQFSVGQRSLLDLLDAENELYQSSSLLVTSKVNQIITAYRLLALNGQLIETIGLPAELYADPREGEKMALF